MTVGKDRRSSSAVRNQKREQRLAYYANGGDKSCLTGRPPVPPEIRFFKHVKKHSDGCWLWTASLVVGSGYGQFTSGIKGVSSAHKFSYFYHKGPIPKGMHVCHTCDVRSCVNPDHLWLGTHTDNMRDMHRKGRANRPTGSANHMFSLKERGFFWTNNGIINKLIGPKGKVPRGFIRGRVVRKPQKPRDTGWAWINNGEMSRQLKRGSRLPAGFSFGRKN